MKPDHLSRIESGDEPTSMEDNILDAQLFVINAFDDQYEDIIKFLTTSFASTEFTIAQNK